MAENLFNICICLLVKSSPDLFFYFYFYFFYFSKDKKIAANIFELGFKGHKSNEEYVLAYIDFLSHQGLDSIEFQCSLHQSFWKGDMTYRVTHLLGKNLPLPWIWDVPPSCLAEKTYRASAYRLKVSGENILSKMCRPLSSR